jgi:hypothetical protein
MFLLLNVWLMMDSHQRSINAMTVKPGLYCSLYSTRHVIALGCRSSVTLSVSIATMYITHVYQTVQSLMTLAGGALLAGSLHLGACKSSSATCFPVTG